ncbi:MAG TPA: acetoacetate decarboxylase family protein [Candidatus Kapabacteria bacterium]|nr:acetoacetate decarboxylase family protein [Candidatus Kapabacteria bacterium]
MQIEPFFQVPQHPHATSAGDVQLPLLYKEADAVLTLFLCDLDRVRQQLEGTGLEPALVVGRRAIVTMAIYDFIHCNIGAYHTLPVSIPVWRDQGFRPRSAWRELFLPADKRHMGFYMLSAPTSSNASCTAGRELWGFPKHLVEIDFKLQGTRVACRMSAGHDSLLEFGGRGVPLSWIMQLDINLFSIKQDLLLRTLLNTRGRFRAHFPFGYQLRLGSTDHPATRPLRALGMDRKRPLALITCADYQGRMQEGVAVERLHRPVAPRPGPNPSHLMA